MFYSAKDEVKNLWIKFINEDKLDDDCYKLRSEIYESWLRSVEYNINPYKVNAPVIDKKLLEQKLKNNARLVSIAIPYMKEIYELVKGSGFRVILTDEQACVLTYIGNEEIPMGDLNEPVAGTLYNEKNIGTNGIFLAIYLDRPIQVQGSEHYCEELHILGESAAPIHDVNGEVIGCLQLASYINNVNPHTLGLVVAAVKGIEKQIKLESVFEEKALISSQQYLTLELISDGVLVIDEKENIVQANSKAVKMTAYDNYNIIGKNIRDVLGCGSFFENIIKTESIYDVECKFNLKDKIINCNVSGGRIKDKNGNIKGLVITLKEMKFVHKLVNKISGATAYYTFDSIIGKSLKIKETIEIAKKAAFSDSNILIIGESGTGKELFAQAIHNYSRRRDEPFIAINCGALPRELVESELFGYEGGTFTGASKGGRPGKFELADGGTIFLDEIGDMPIDTQVSLLRVIQNKEVLRIGGKEPKKIDVRVIAATNKNLMDMVLNKSFREDLFYRLNVINLNIPALRERKEDIKLLTDYLINKIGYKMGKYSIKVKEEVYGILESYNWPGNIRELENLIERLVVLNDGNFIDLKDLPENIYYKQTSHQIKEDKESLSDKEKELIEKYLYIYSGNIKKAAEKLNVARSTIYHKILKYNINLDKYRK